MENLALRLVLARRREYTQRRRAERGPGGQWLNGPPGQERVSIDTL